MYTYLSIVWAIKTGFAFFLTENINIKEYTDKWLSGAWYIKKWSKMKYILD
jgi:hypothetical protein